MIHSPDCFSPFFLQEIADNCDLILERINKYDIDYDFYSRSSEYQDLLAMPLLRICEIARSYTDDPDREYPGYDWAAAAKMPTRTAHPCSGFDPEVVWVVATSDIGALQERCKKYLFVG